MSFRAPCIARYIPATDNGENRPILRPRQTVSPGPACTMVSLARGCVCEEAVLAVSVVLTARGA
jgi:hypothetical protein